MNFVTNYFILCFLIPGIASAQSIESVNEEVKSSIISAVDSSFSKSQNANQRHVELYKENAEFSYTSPLGEIGAPSKYVLMGKLTNVYMLVGTKNSRIGFAVIPDFTVRVRDESSAGVRTPDFKLGGALYARLSSHPERYSYAELGFTHHSNGQDDEALNSDGSLNTRTGNFSTNSLSASFRFGREFGIPANGSSHHSIHHRLGLKWNKWFAYESVLEDDYGFTRLLYNFSWRNYTHYQSSGRRSSWRKTAKENPDAGNPGAKLEKESLRFNLDVSYAVNQMALFELANADKRLNVEAALHGSLPFMNRAMLMVSGGYYGEDPYNIYYRDRYPYLRVGISTGFIRYRIDRQ